MNKGIIFLGGFILFMFLVAALDFTPQGNINLRNVYNITNGVNASFVNVDLTGNITTNVITFTRNATHQVYSNSTCVIITGSTSTLNIC